MTQAAQSESQATQQSQDNDTGGNSGAGTVTVTANLPENQTGAGVGEVIATNERINDVKQIAENTKEDSEEIRAELEEVESWANQVSANQIAQAQNLDKLTTLTMTLAEQMTAMQAALTSLGQTRSKLLPSDAEDAPENLPQNFTALTPIVEAAKQNPVEQAQSTVQQVAQKRIKNWF